MYLNLLLLTKEKDINLQILDYPRGETFNQSLEIF